MEQQIPNKKNQNKDLSNSSSNNNFKKFQIRGGRFEKGLFVLLIIIAAGFIPVTIWQLNNNLTDSFFSPNDPSDEDVNAAEQLVDSLNTDLPIIENLRELDTDGDGLNDYDELYRYKTSPYISDSDSDSKDDKLEIDQGTDPNCPEGNTCSREEFIVDPAEEAPEGEAATSVEDLTVDQLRQIMIDAGAPEDQVYQISEEDLRSAYQEILKEEGISGDAGTITTGQSGDSLGLDFDGTEPDSSIYSKLDYDTLINLGPADIRLLLIEGGVSEEELSQVDDETLQQVYKESLYQNFNELQQQ